MESFEKRFRSLRGNLTQEQFASRLGLTKQKISNYENGVVRPTYDVFEALALKGYDLNWLLTGKKKEVNDDILLVADKGKRIYQKNKYK